MTDPWLALRHATSARIGLGRAGSALPTRHALEFAAAHAAARDAVHVPLDVSALGFELSVSSAARDRGEYLRRPDLGRMLSPGTRLPRVNADVGVVVADGLSPRAVNAHAPGLLAELAAALDPALTVAPVVVATQARVALGDHVARHMGTRTVVVLIGERPGLSVTDSLGVYLTHHPRETTTDADRNCVSNVHGRGMDYRTAAILVAALINGARRLGSSGVNLRPPPPHGEL